MEHRQNWGESRVYFHNAEGRLVSLPAEWTDLFPLDPFVEISAGRAAFRVRDLLELSQLLRQVQAGGAR